MGLLEPKQGPRCHECPLFEHGIPTADRMPLNAEWSGLTLVGEQPGRAEVKAGIPFIGPSGRLLWAICDHVGVPPGAVHVTNCIRCGLKGGRKLSESKGHLAMECCKPLLQHNLRELGPTVVCGVGAIPWLSLSGLQGIDKWRGTVQPPTDDEPWWIMATLHPAGLLRVEARRILIELMMADLRQAYNLSTGLSEVWEPHVVDTADWVQVEAFMQRVLHEADAVAVDVETDGIDSLTCNLLTVGVAHDMDEGAAISLPWPDAFPDYWTKAQAVTVKWFLTTLLLDPVTSLVFHNKSYDIPVLRRHLGEFSAKTGDTLLMHHAAFPKLPHTLEQVTSQFLLTEPWKSEYGASDVEEAWKDIDSWEDVEAAERARQRLSERALGELMWYNAADAGATILLYRELLQAISENHVWDVYRRDNELMDIAIRMHEDGIGIDLNAARALAGDYREALDVLEEELRQMSGFPDQCVVDAAIKGCTLAIDLKLDERRFVRAQGAAPGSDPVKAIDEEVKQLRAERRDYKKVVSWQEFNPGSPIQLRDVLAQRGLTPTKVTKKTMQASTSKASLWDLRHDQFVDTLMRWREKFKLWSTYLNPMERKIGDDNRIHPVWKLHSTPSGRFGTAPAVQNWPYDMKQMMIPSPGCKIVGADYAALELRVVALLSGEPEWVELFQANGDLHAAMAYYYFPTEFPRLDEEWQAVEGDEDAKNKAVPGRKALRGAGKPVSFGDIYLGSAQTLFEQIRLERPDVKTEKEQKRLLREVTAMQKRLRAATPTRLKWAAIQHETAERTFELRTARWEDPETGELQGGRLRKWPMGEASPNETANHPIQGMAADIANAALRRLVRWLKELGLYRNGIWPILQIHDALYLEVEDVPLADVLPMPLHEGRILTYFKMGMDYLYVREFEHLSLPEFAARLLERAMFTRIEYTSPVTQETNWMEFPADARVGDNVAEV
jgi:uracil-DNA glycosylase family 4